MAESEIITTPARPTLRFKVFLMVSVPCSTRESSFEIGMAKSPNSYTKSAYMSLQANKGYILLHFLRIHMPEFRKLDFSDDLHLDRNWRR